MAQNKGISGSSFKYVVQQRFEMRWNDARKSRNVKNILQVVTFTNGMKPKDSTMTSSKKVGLGVYSAIVISISGFSIPL